MTTSDFERPIIKLEHRTWIRDLMFPNLNMFIEQYVSISAETFIFLHSINNCSIGQMKINFQSGRLVMLGTARIDRWLLPDRIPRVKKYLVRLISVIAFFKMFKSCNNENSPFRHLYLNQLVLQLWILIPEICWNRQWKFIVLVE